MSVENAITANGLQVTYQTADGIIQALDCKKLKVEAGTSIAVMGPSGSGKSTLLGLLAGLAVPSQGTITIGSTTISALAEQQRVLFRRRYLGMVYQADNLLPFLTLEENISLQLAISLPAEESRQGSDISALLERLGLAGLERRLPDQLSGGQRQRAAVARAIVHQPKVILADEPTGALDDDAAAAVIRLLVEVQREMRATLVVVTHDDGIASRLDRILRLDPPLPPPEERSGAG